MRVTVADDRWIKPKQFEQLLPAVVNPRPRPAQQSGNRFDICPDGQVREQADARGDMTDAPAQRDRIHAGNILAGHDDLAGRRLDHPVDEINDCGLAAPGRPEQADEITLGHVEIEIRNSDRPVQATLLDAPKRNHRLSRHRLRPTPPAPIAIIPTVEPTAPSFVFHSFSIGLSGQYRLIPVTSPCEHNLADRLVAWRQRQLERRQRRHPAPHRTPDGDCRVRGDCVRPRATDRGVARARRARPHTRCRRLRG